MNRLAAVVLCGGVSAGMDKDKGSMPYGNSIRAVQAAAKAIELNLDVYYSIREEQIPLYAPYIDAGKLISGNNSIGSALNGLISAHLRLPEQDILLLTCDMTSLQCTAFYTTVREYISCDNDFFAFGKKGSYQPFCAVYTAAGLRKALTGNPSSLQDVLKSGDTLSLTYPDDDLFLNLHES